MSDTSNEQPRVLIVDDTPENIDVLGEVLKPHYRRAVATNGERALAIAQSDDPPDLILLDIMMPGMDGYEVCRRLKADEKTRDIPVIFVTAKSEIDDETKGFDLGAVDYITKPIVPPIVLARVKAHIELKRARETVEKQNEIMAEELALARRLQRNLIPQSDLWLDGLEAAFQYEPAIQIGGDVLDIIAIDESRALFFVGDAMGHGVRAALVMAAAKTALTAAAMIDPEPASVLAYINRTLTEMFKNASVTFVTAVCCLVDVSSNEASVALAGHSGPLVWRGATGEIFQLEGSGLLLGIEEDSTYQSETIPFVKGDALALTTDGIEEAFDPDRKQYGKERLQTQIRSHGAKSAEDIVKAIRADVMAHCQGRPLSDDYTVLVVKRT